MTQQPAEEKKKVQERLDVFEQLLEENPFVQKQRALGEAEGKAEGELQTLRNVVVDIVQTRCPSQAELAERKVARITQPETLRTVIHQLILAPNKVAILLVVNGIK